MNFKIKVKYITIYLILNAMGFSLAFTFWWTDSIILSGLNKYTLILLSSMGICWLGTLVISIMLSRMLIFKPDNFNFISPLDLISNQYFNSEIGTANATKFKSTISLIAFPLFFLTIVTFIFSINLYENNQLRKYGIVETVIVKELHYDLKQNPYAYLKYQNYKNSVNLSANSLKINDKVKIIYSNRNPKIVKYLNEHKK